MTTSCLGRHRSTHILVLQVICSLGLLVLGTEGVKLFKGLAYSPFAADPTRFCLTTSEITRDLFIVSQLTRKLRLYSISSCSEATTQVLEYALDNSMTVMLGLWVSKDTANNENEFTHLLSLLTTYGDSGVINGIAVGNEAITTENVDVDYLVTLIRRVRIMVHASWDIPITTVEVATIWDNVQDPTSTAHKLVPEVDYVGANVHPYFEGLPVNCSGLKITGCFDGPTWAVNRAVVLGQTLGMRVVLTETGWPTQGESSSSLTPYGFPSTSPHFMAVPSVNNSRNMMLRFTDLADQAGLEYYYFEPFDADWKRIYVPCRSCQHLSSCIDGACTYDYNWGLCTGSRESKPGMGVNCTTPFPLVSSSPRPPPAQPRPSVANGIATPTSAGSITALSLMAMFGKALAAFLMCATLM